MNTPSTVPTGICTQFNPAMTSEKVRCFFRRIKSPERRLLTPIEIIAKPKTTSNHLKMARTSAGGGPSFCPFHISGLAKKACMKE